MKILFNILLILTFLFEALAAVSLIGGPDGIAAAGTGKQWSMHYGFAALTIATLPVWAWPYRTNLALVTLVLGVLFTFHTAISVSLMLAGDQQTGMIIHSTLAILSVALLTQRTKWCDLQIPAGEPA